MIGQLPVAAPCYADLSAICFQFQPGFLQVPAEDAHRKLPGRAIFGRQGHEFDADLNNERFGHGDYAWGLGSGSSAGSSFTFASLLYSTSTIHLT